ncbi:MAG: hypothetical protein ABIE84_03220 [bacterium]
MRFVICLLLVSWLLVIATASQALELAGSYENNPLIGIRRDSEIIYGDLNKLRLKYDYNFNKDLTIHLEPRYYTFLSPTSLSLPGADQLNRLVWDQVYIKAYSKTGNITIGKQRIAWGTGYIWNPTDVANPQTLSFAVREEDETNVQALRAELPLDELSGIDAFVLTDSDWRSARKGVRLKTNVNSFDFSVSHVDFGDGGFQLGCDSAGELFGFGVRHELAMISEVRTNVYIRSVWGVDNTLPDGFYVNAEYYFNGQGGKKKEDYDWATSIRGMDYLYLGVRKLFDEIRSVSYSAIINLDDLSYIFYPSYSQSLSDNLDLNLEAMILGGDNGSEYCPPVAEDTAMIGGSKFVLVRLLYSF